jgi:hypothetical protein
MPIMPMVFEESLSNKPRIINPKPIAAITSKRKMLKCISNHTPKFTNVNSKIISQIPLVSKNLLLSFTLFLLVKEIKADVPERKTKTGAHKCVIQRVKNKAGVVVFKSVGDCVMEVVCSKSLTWSKAIITITIPLTISILLILFIKDLVVLADEVLTEIFIPFSFYYQICH